LDSSNHVFSSLITSDFPDDYLEVVTAPKDAYRGLVTKIGFSMIGSGKQKLVFQIFINGESKNQKPLADKLTRSTLSPIHAIHSQLGLLFL